MLWGYEVVPIGEGWIIINERLERSSASNHL